MSKLPTTLSRICGLLSKWTANRYSAIATFHTSIPDTCAKKMESPPTNSRAIPSEEPKQPTTNRLAGERSPYLLQHATNPVQWYPWCDEAIETAKSENKLIFLSVGYSTCHWCHVMEYESFCDQTIAAIMNENFVNIKVDREERPDVDAAYMNFIRLACGQAGWPMSVFLAPDLNPIGGGTYFPPQDAWGRPGFKSVLLAFAKKWKQSPEEVRSLGVKVATKLAEACSFGAETTASLTKGAVPDMASAHSCFDQLSRHYDNENGGFELAPKFPQPCISDFLLHYYSLDTEAERNASALAMVSHTLERMSKGGIRDHIGQGFARYSTDEKWHVPHFEKMLYDQAQLTTIYATAYAVTKKPIFREIVDDILTYVDRDLRYKEGGFCSAEDADSLPTVQSTKKREGAFYLWTFDEVETYLSQPLRAKPQYTLSDLFSYHYNVRKEGNVERSNDPHNEFLNQNILFISEDEDETAAKFAITVEEVRQELETARQILFDKRNERPRPRLDTKIIVSWNGLMLSGYSKAAQILANDHYKSRAVETASFLLQHLWSEDENKLLRCCYVDEKRENIVESSTIIHGFLNDYAFLIRGLLDLYECTFDWRWIEWCERLQNVQNDLFWNDDSRIYDTVSSNHHFNLLPQREDSDGVEPSGNSVSVRNLIRLGCLLNRNDFHEKGEQLLSSFASRLSTYPISLPEMVAGLMMYHAGPTQILIVANGHKEEATRMLSVVHEYYIPNRVLALIEDDTVSESSPFYQQLLPILRNVKSDHDKSAMTFVCRNRTCALPVTTTDALRSLLSSS